VRTTSASKTCRTIDGRHEANPKQRIATAESDFSYLQSSKLLEYMMAMNHALFEGDRVFAFQINASHLKQEIAEWQLLSSVHIYAYHLLYFLLGVAIITPHLKRMSSIRCMSDLQVHALINQSLQQNSSLQELIGYFSHRVFTLVADTPNSQWL